MVYKDRIDQCKEMGINIQSIRCFSYSFNDAVACVCHKKKLCESLQYLICVRNCPSHSFQS
jgi:hypothetical protein